MKKSLPENKLKPIKRIFWLLLAFVFGVQSSLLAQNADVVEITRTPSHLAEGKIGQKVLATTLHVKTHDSKHYISFEARGKDTNQFSITTTSIDPGTSETDVQVFYTPTKIGEHNIMLYINCPDKEELSGSFRIRGIAIDPKNPPQVSVAPTTLVPFETAADTRQEQTLRITSKNAAQSVSVTLKQRKAFILSTGLMYKNITGNLRVTFAPKTAGTFRDTIVLTTYGTQPLLIPIQGTATPKQTVDTKEGDEWVLSTDNPLTVLKESFEVGKKNKPLSIERWKNVAVQGKRAWWFYTVPASREYGEENVAKITPYDSKIEYGDEQPCEMTLVTPPLDFKHAVNKVLTFRVRGDYLRDDQTDRLTIYYITLENGKPQMYPLEFPGLPTTKDKSGEWQELQLDFTGQNLADVIFFGFNFKSQRGPSNSATYYIDDVTFGRPDLPRILPSESEITLATGLNTPAISKVITVNGENLTQDIQLKVGGSHASKFKLTTKTLPAQGGDFVVTFKANREARYKAYVKISSRGAADKYIDLQAAAVTGIATVNATTTPQPIYDLQGRRVLRPTSGCYIVGGKKVYF